MEGIARCGFGVVVVDPDGSLVGVGGGVPPFWVTDSAGAELWAVFVVLDMCARPPRITTDCKTIVSTVHRGLHMAITDRNTMARL